METIAEQSFKPSILITPPTPLLSRVNKEVIQESKTPDSDEFMKLEMLCKTPKVFETFFAYLKQNFFNSFVGVR